MHELSIAESLLAIVQDEITRHCLKKVVGVKVKVGKLTAIQPDALSFCFELITENTPLKGVTLDIEVLAIKGYCEECKEDFELEEPAMICPKCESWNVRIKGGREMYLSEIETE